MLRKEVRIIVGIDPGKKTGYGEYCLVSGELKLKTVSFWGAHDLLLDKLAELGDVKLLMVLVEISRTSHVWHRAGYGRREVKVGQDVGGVRVQGELLLSRVLDWGVEGESFSPMGKFCHKSFVGITGYKGRTNQHERDAGMAAFSVGIKMKKV